MFYPTNLSETIVQFIIQNLNFQIPNTKVQLTDINLSFAKQKYGLIGDNGIGKTTFFKLITGRLKPHSGRLVVPSFSYLQQEPQKEQTIQEVLEIDEIMAALFRIQNGSIAAHDFDLAQNNWDLEQRIKLLFDEWRIAYLQLNTPFSDLSGGEQTKIQIIKAILSQAELILLDEPTNHLDKNSRTKLMDWIEASKQLFIIISHDRKLLSKMDGILELNSKGMQIYGGNYELYCAQKEMMEASIAQKISQATRELSGVAQSKQDMLEKKSNNISVKKSKEKDKILKGFQKNQSEKSKSKLIQASDNKIEAATLNLQNLKNELEIKEKIKIALPKTHVPQQKIVLNIEHLEFSYSNQVLLFKDFNLNITGPVRVAITGDNGSGKSTLSQIIMQKLKPQKGSVYIGVEHVQYLSQFGDFADVNLSIIENFQAKNPDLSNQEAFTRLAQFNFRNIQAQKLIKHLSGGEKIRAGLAASLLSNHPPQLLILDEPSNHLDMGSLKAIEDILALYQGALIVISHDESFLEGLRIDKRIQLNPVL